MPDYNIAKNVISIRKRQAHSETLVEEAKQVFIDPLTLINTAVIRTGMNIPLHGGRVHQHLAANRTGLAYNGPETAYRGATAGMLATDDGIGKGLISRCMFGMHL